MKNLTKKIIKNLINYNNKIYKALFFSSFILGVSLFVRVNISQAGYICLDQYSSCSGNWADINACGVGVCGTGERCCSVAKKTNTNTSTNTNSSATNKINNAWKNPDNANSNSNAAPISLGNQNNNTSANNVSGSGQLNIPTFNLPNPQGGIKEIAQNLLNWLLGILGIIAIISFIITGLQYFMAAGDEQIVQSAKKNMTYSILGIIVALSGFIIIQAIDAALRATSFF